MNDYSALEARPRHEWNLEQLLTLMILVEGYDNEWRHRRKIFGNYFGIGDNELSEQALRAMWHQSKPKFRGSFGEFNVIRDALECTASNSSVVLCRKTFQQGFGEPEFPVSRNIIKKKKNEVFAIPSHRDYRRSSNRFKHMKILTDDPPNFLRTPQQSRQSGGFLTPPSTGQKKRKYIPCIGFRAFSVKNHGINSQDGFVAGKFVHARLQNIPSSTSLEYREDAIRHVTRKNNQPTPFVSVHKNLLRALHMAFHHEGSSIAVVDLRSIKNIEHVKPLKLLPGDPYQGIGEYLVYGEIKKESLIQVISLRDFLDRVSVIPDDLLGLHILRMSSSTDEGRQQIKKTLPRLNFAVGRSIGNLLKVLEIPSWYWKDTTGTIVQDWQFPGYKRWKENLAFLKGVNERNETCSRDFIKELREAAKSSYACGKAPFTEGLARFISSGEENFEDSGMEESTDFINELREAARLENKPGMEPISGSLSSFEETEDAEMEVEGFSDLEDELHDIEEILQCWDI